MNRKPYLVFSAIVLLLLMASCSSSPGKIELTIDMDEFSFSPQDLEFQVGQEVLLHLTNVGALEHEIMFGRDVEYEDGQPHSYESDMFEMAGVEPEVSIVKGDHPVADEHTEDEMGTEEEHGHGGFMVEVPPGEDEYTISFTVTEDMVGEWEIGCFDQNGVHYTAGMVGSLTVIP